MTAPGGTLARVTETDNELEQRLAGELGDDSVESSPADGNGETGNGDGGGGESEAAAAPATTSAPADPPAPATATKRKSGKRAKATATSEQDAETAQDQLARATADYKATVAEIMGDDFAGLVESPLDWIPGYLWNPAMVPVDEDTARATLELLNGDQPPQDDTTRRCPRCNGWGVLMTGSRADGKITRICARCEGGGWVANVDDELAARRVDEPAETTPPALPAPPTTGLPDAWGRPAGHPHWGITPAEVGT